MAARIARGSNRRAAPKRAPARSVSTRRSKRPGPLERLGFSADAARRFARWTIGGMVAAVAIAALIVFRVPQMAGEAMAEGVGMAGFSVQRVEPRGLNRVRPMQVYWIATDQLDRPMPQVDLERVRGRLLRLGWVKEARVSRRLPDTLVIDIVERVPVAIWQHAGRFNLIDAEGAVLEAVRVEAKPDLPLVVGPDANRQYATLERLLAAAPHLKPQVEAANWIGGRRWDVHFQTGEVLTLPEGEEAALAAIGRFAGMDRQTPLLGRGFVRFDMRDPRQMVVRVSREPGSIVPEAAPDPGQPPQDLARTI